MKFALIWVSFLLTGCITDYATLTLESVEEVKPLCDGNAGVDTIRMRQDLTASTAIVYEVTCKNKASYDMWAIKERLKEKGE